MCFVQRRTFIRTEIEENKALTPLKGLQVKKQVDGVVMRERFSVEDIFERTEA